MRKILCSFIFILIFSVPSLLSQPLEITGKIVGEDNTGIPGVNVVIKGTTTGTVTDVDGNYRITVPGAETILQFSYVGYLTEEITVGNQTVISISLVPDIARLEEVVVVGYGTISKQNLTTAISKIDPEDVPVAANNNVSQLLFGRAAGLQVVQRNAEPGGMIDLSIRGRGNPKTTLRGGYEPSDRQNPLIVIDGVVYPNDVLEPDNGTIELQGVNRGGLAGLNPNDIESIEILKDASAAIYGVAAANGVILITTKKGKAGKLNVTYDGSRSMVKVMNYLEPLDAADYMTYYNYLYEDDYYFDRRMKPFGSIPALGFKAPYPDSVIAAAGEGTNWLDEIFRSGSIDNHSLTISGGSEKVTYYFSGNYFYQKGILEHSDLTRYNGRLNVSFQLTKFLNLYTSVNATRNSFTNSGAGSQAGGSGSQGYGMLQAALAYDPTLPVRNEDGKFSQFGIIANPVGMMDIKDNTISSGILSTVSLEIDIIPELLKGKLLYGNNYETANRDFYVPSDIYWGQVYLSRGSLFEDRRQNQTMEGILNLNKSLGTWLTIDAMCGIGQYQDDENGYGIEASNMLDAIHTSRIEAAPTKTAFSSRSTEKKRSYFARGNFDIMDRYLVMLAIRYDGYDKFFPENKYAAFPSVSIGWKLSNEPFLREVDAINQLKLRASIGTTGKTYGTIAMGRYESDRNGTRQVQAVFNDGQYIYPAFLQVALDQPDLEWEKTIMSNVGLDFSLFRSRLSGSVDLFKDDNPNLIYRSAPTAPLAAIQTYPVNSGKQERKGYEIALNTININAGNFEWTSNLNISHYKYNWIERAPYEGLESFIQEDDPVYAIYVYETNGILQVGDTLTNYQPSGARYPGAPVFVDRDGNDSLNNNDVVMYTMDPKIIIGFGNNFRIKNWDIGVFFYGQFGTHDWNNSYAWADPLAFVNGVQNGSQDIKNVWSINNPDGTLPGVAYNESALGLNASVDTWLDKKDFFRCRNITLGYTFDIPAIKEHVSNLRLYFDAQNPFIITKYKGGDPEINFPKPRVSAAAPYPMTSTFSVGVNASF